MAKFATSGKLVKFRTDHSYGLNSWVRCASGNVWVQGDCGYKHGGTFGYFWYLGYLSMAMHTASGAPSFWIKAALLPPKTDPSPSILPFQTFVTFRAAAQVFNATPHPHQFSSFTFASISSGDTFSMCCHGFYILL